MTSERPDGRPALLEAFGVAKHRGPVVALTSGSSSAAPGEVDALILALAPIYARATRGE